MNDIPPEGTRERAEVSSLQVWLSCECVCVREREIPTPPPPLHQKKKGTGKKKTNKIVLKG